MKKSDGTLLTILKRISPGTLLLLAITLAANGFAWFIYSTKVDSGITAHVRAWDIQFLVGDTPLVQEIDFDVEDVYPGMETYTASVVATNNGEESANFTYEVLSANILGIEYQTNDNYTSNDLIFDLQHLYPFTVNFTATSDSINAGGGSSTFTFTFSWPYESGNDILDTSWGMMAYDFYSTNPLATSAISLRVKLTAIQSNRE